MGLAGSTQGKINGNLAIGEFLGVPISTHLLYQLLDLRDLLNGFAWLLLLSVILAGIFIWKRQFGAALVLVFALYAGLTHARYMGLFSITVVTLGATLLGNIFASSYDAEDTVSPKLRAPSATVLLVTIFLCAVALLHIADFASNRTYVVFSPDLRFGAGESSWFPARAAAFIQREQLPGNIFEDYELGGYAAWSLGPKYPDFIDGRGIGAHMGLDQFNLYGEDPDSLAWRNEAERWKLNVLLVPTAGLRGLQNIDPYKFCRSTAWRPVYMDEVSLVFLRDSPENMPWLSRLQIDCFTQPLIAPDSASRPALHEFYLNSGGLYYELHRDREAQESLRLASLLYRADPRVHFLDALLLERGQRYVEAEQEYRDSIAITEDSGVWYSLSGLYEKQGQYANALQALKQAAQLSTQPYNIYITMGKLQMVLGSPEQSLDSFDKADKSSPYRNGAESLAPEVYANLAECRSEAHRKLEHWNKAIAFQREAIRRTPLAVRRWDRLARLYEATGQIQPAGQVRQHILELQMSVNSKASEQQH
jgi:tetratricopeptide (TPR) repeat protein